MAVQSKYAVGGGLFGVLLLVFGYRRIQEARRAARQAAQLNAGGASSSELAERALSGAKKERVQVDRVFLSRFWRLLRIMVPGVFTREFFFVFLVGVCLVLRSLCDIYLLRITTKIEAIIISRDARGFPAGLAQFLVAVIPVALVNNLLKYSLAEMVMCFRSRLTHHLYNDYLIRYTYYQINNLDNRISNPDQVLTQDLQRFVQSVTDFYSNVSKPLLDIAIYCKKLSGALGVQGPVGMLGYLFVSATALTWLRHPQAKFTVDEQKLEGEYRAVNSRLITNSEEIAFYGGNEKEKGVIQKAFDRLMALSRRAQQFRCSLGILDDAIAKYFATVVGFYIVSRPFLDLSHPRHLNSTNSEIMQDYYQSGRMLMNLAHAVGRLALAGRELTRLAGFTARITEVITVLDDLNNDRYQRTMVGDTSSKLNSADSSSSSSSSSASRGSDRASQMGFRPHGGTKIIQSGIIRFDGVPLVTPNGDVLVPSLSFEVRHGINVLVAGPNGCGKSSLFRTLGDLWPIFGGTLVKPAKEQLFYIPQRPYMTLGTLRDQIIYPHFPDRSPERDAELIQFLEQVQLADLPSRFPGGLDAVEDWMDVLSGGEKQRIAMARLFYHRPQFAILDECTSQVSVDVEGFMYKNCHDLGISLFTVSHRKSLWQYHEKILKFDGRGAYQFCPISEVKDD